MAIANAGRRTTRLPVPVSFAIVVAGLIALFIFFGAWAVSVDAANHEVGLSFAVGNAGSGFGVNPVPSESSAVAAPGDALDAESSADSWWGRTLLVACPLH